MLIRVSPYMTLEVQHLTRRGEVYQLYMRVPVDLVSKYGTKFIRQSLKTKDQREALQKLKPLVAHYQAEWDRLRADDRSIPAAISTDARELAKLLAENEGAADFLFEPRRVAYAQQSADPEDTYHNADPSAYLKPEEAQAIKLLEDGALDKPFLSDALGLYLELHQKGSETKFRQGIQREWKRLIAHCGDIPCESLSRPQARSFVDQLLRTGLKTTSVRRTLRAINAVLNMAFQELEIDKSHPFRLLKIAGEGADASPAKVPSMEQLKSLAAALETKESTTAIIAAIMLETGPRIAEISGLRVSDVVLDAEIPHLRIAPNEWRDLKTASSRREVPLVGLSLKAAHKAVKQAGDGAALFPTYARSRGNDSASAAVNKLLKPYGITSHSFRHSLKDRLREAGCTEDIRDAIQGHANGSIAETYGKGHTLKTMHQWLVKAKVT